MKISGWQLIAFALLILGLYFDRWNLGLACVLAIMIHDEKRITKRIKKLEEIMNSGDKP